MIETKAPPMPKDIHEIALDIFSRLFKQKDKVLEIDIKKDNIEIYNQYKNDMFFICKFHGATFGINEKGKLPSKIKFTVDASDYNIELNMKGENEENTVIFSERRNRSNYISLKIK